MKGVIREGVKLAFQFFLTPVIFFFGQFLVLKSRLNLSCAPMKAVHVLLNVTAEEVAQDIRQLAQHDERSRDDDDDQSPPAFVYHERRQPALKLVRNGSDH